MKIITNHRSNTTSTEIEILENEWWQKFAEIEDRFAWVQTPQMQKILRGKYVKKIINLIKPGGSILELGCGAGWLSIALARAGATKVVGIDFSQAQIEIANKNASIENLSDVLMFECADGTQETTPSEQYDCVVVHGFLHHLNVSEINRTIASVNRFLKPGGLFIVFEPVRYGEYDNSRVLTKWEKRLAFLSRLANAGRRFGIRHTSPEEKRWRDLIKQRNWGLQPHGPSPKEMPFEPGEMENYLQAHFLIQQKDICMALSHLITQEWLLRGISHPISTKFLLPLVARLAAKWDHILVTQLKPLPGLWSFTMFVCRQR